MPMVNTLTVIGTRPEAIKMAMLIKKLSRHKQIRNYVCITAQHRDMLDQVLDFFCITPDFDLDLMQENQSLNAVSARIIAGLDAIFTQVNPDLVFVHGDTNTSFAAALAAFYRRIPIAHIEAGMRTGNMHVPFPEEANRVLTSRITDWHFAPTRLNVQHLIKEGVSKKKIVRTGNTVIDSLLFTASKVKGFSTDVADHSLIHAVRSRKKIVLVTGHRRENFGSGFDAICNALKKIAGQHPEIYIIYPVHLNPNVQGPVKKILSGIPNILLTAPLKYPDFIFLMKRAYIILTDSGGIQEEGPSLGKPVLVMRDVTERPEAVKAGTVKLVGTNTKKIVATVNELLADTKEYKKMAATINPYGDGKATDRIIQWLSENASSIIKKPIE